jgi:hypothetical protein
MGRTLRVKTWELLAVALAGFVLGGSMVYGLFTLPLEGRWRAVNAALVGLGQIFVILAILRGAFARTRLASQAEPSQGEA